jgi:hypothetical protein
MLKTAKIPALCIAVHRRSSVRFRADTPTFRARIPGKGNGICCADLRGAGCRMENLSMPRTWATKRFSRCFPENVITKIHVLDEFDEIPFCTDYKYKGSILKKFPADTAILAEVEPVYKNIRGWKKSVAGTKEWSELPTLGQDYLKFLSDYLEIPVSMVSTGPGRDETIHL